MYRALFTGDIHCSNSLPYAKRDPKSLVSDRLLDTLIILEDMCAYACSESIEDIWIVGDLLDKRLLDAVTNKMVAAKLNKIRKEHRVAVVPGNHEAGDARGLHYSLDAFKEIGVWVAKGGGSSAPSWIPDVACIPYMPDNDAIKLLHSLADCSDPPIVLMHQTIQGAREGSWISPHGIPLGILETFPQVISGHFHTHQKLTDSIWYLGAPLQHNFGDQGETRGFWDLQIGDDRKIHSADLIASDVPLFLEIDWPEMSSADDRESILSGIEGGYLRVRVADTVGSMSNLADAEELCSMAMSELGARYARAVHIPSPEPHRDRLQVKGSRTWDAAISGYLDVCDVTGETRSILDELGRELVRDAEKQGS